MFDTSPPDQCGQIMKLIVVIFPGIDSKDEPATALEQSANAQILVMASVGNEEIRAVFSVLPGPRQEPHRSDPIVVGQIPHDRRQVTAVCRVLDPLSQPQICQPEQCSNQRILLLQRRHGCAGDRYCEWQRDPTVHEFFRAGVP